MAIAYVWMSDVIEQRKSSDDDQQWRRERHSILYGLIEPAEREKRQQAIGKNIWNAQFIGGIPARVCSPNLGPCENNAPEREPSKPERLASKKGFYLLLLFRHVSRFSHLAEFFHFEGIVGRQEVVGIRVRAIVAIPQLKFQSEVGP